MSDNNVHLIYEYDVSTNIIIVIIVIIEIDQVKFLTVPGNFFRDSFTPSSLTQS